MNQGSTVQFTATVLDGNGYEIPNVGVTWVSEEEGIATIDDDGMATGLAEGETMISAQYQGVDGATILTVEGTRNPLSKPGEIQGLAVESVTEHTVTIRWTQVDDGGGGPAKYALRYGTPTISWGGAYSTEVSVEGTDIGTPLEYTWTGLEEGTPHQFQIVAYRGILDVAAVFGRVSSAISATTTSPPQQDPEVELVTASPSEVSLTALEETVSLEVVAEDPFGNPVPDAIIEWSSLNTSVATVDQMGILTARAMGSALVVASAVCCGSADTVSVEVQQLARDVVISPSTVDLLVGGTRQLSAAVKDQNGFTIPGAPVIWSSFNSSTASVSTTGLVRAESPGSVAIRAESNQSANGQASVVVSAAPPPFRLRKGWFFRMVSNRET